MRVDLYLSSFGHTPSRKKAQDLIAAGAVRIDGQTVKKASAAIDENVTHEVEIDEIFRYVSRGGMKLEVALDAFGVKATRKKAVDIGASTGGFTDCLLQRGAVRVYAIDAGIAQLHEKIRTDSRVVCLEKFNARNLTPEVTDGLCDIAVVDVSFISQTYIIPNISAVLRDGGDFISLIKPQFEAGRTALGKSGVVHNSAHRFVAVKRVIQCALANGFVCADLIPSPIEGGDGNIEYLAYFIKNGVAKRVVDDRRIRRITSM